MLNINICRVVIIRQLFCPKLEMVQGSATTSVCVRVHNYTDWHQAMA